MELVKFSSSSSSSQPAEPPNHRHNDSELMDAQFEGDDPSIPIARGGPIYISNMVTSSITSVPLFQHRLLYQVKILQAELLQHSSSSSHDDDDDDISYVYYAHSASFFLLSQLIYLILLIPFTVSMTLNYLHKMS